MNIQDFYRQRVAECSAEAAGAALPNVRERALRSQASWQAMLDRDERTNRARDENERGKAFAAAVLADGAPPPD